MEYALFFGAVSFVEAFFHGRCGLSSRQFIVCWPEKGALIQSPSSGGDSLKGK